MRPYSLCLVSWFPSIEVDTQTEHYVLYFVSGDESNPIHAISTHADMHSSSYRTLRTMRDIARGMM